MQQIRQKQVRGQIGESLEDDIKSINNELQYFDPPVRRKIDLPINENTDGNMRVVLDENKIYVWDESKSEWITQCDIYTDNAFHEIVLSMDGQKLITTPIKVGIPGGMTTIDTVELYVNGMLQKQVRDYSVIIDTDFNCVLEWKSRDFYLETSDTITMSYSILFLS